MGAVVLGVLRRARLLDELMQHNLYSMSGPYYVDIMTYK
jgi:hypothetical protein